MADQKPTILKLKNSEYVPILKDQTVYYGGSQMWFPEDRWFSKNHIIHNYGCGTIATADLFLYLALRNGSYRNSITETVLQGLDSAYYMDYMAYVRTIDQYYTNTRRWIAVIGPKIASAFNSYCKAHDMKFRAKWRLSLSFYDMLEIIEEMLSLDLPVILSIGPNTPNLWGKTGIKFYQQYTALVPAKNTDNPTIETETVFRYREAMKDVNGHYVTVTGLWKDPETTSLMLSISSWGKKYYINYEEYRDYIDDHSGTFTSSILHIH